MADIGLVSTDGAYDGGGASVSSGGFGWSAPTPAPASVFQSSPIVVPLSSSSDSDSPLSVARGNYQRESFAARSPYLDAIGLRRLADEELQGDFFGLPHLPIERALDDSGVVTQEQPTGKGDPFATLADLFERLFAQAEPSPAAPVIVVGDATAQSRGAGGRGSAGLILVVLAIGAGAFYWFYLRKKGASDG